MSDKIKQILNGLTTKATLKQDVYRRTKSIFENLFKLSQGLNAKVQKQICDDCPDVITEVNSLGDYEFHFKFSGDTIVFIMHTNVFTFPPSHGVSKSNFVKQDPDNGYFGMIQVYNFLSDSIKYNRLGDPGYLLARIYVNHNDHFYVEGKRQLGFLYKDIEKNTLSDETLEAIIEQCVIYCLDFDLYVPPLEGLAQISVQQKNYFNNPTGIATGKRLGFRIENSSNKS